MKFSAIQLKLVRIIYITAIFFLFGCTSNQPKINSNRVDFLITQGDLHWQQRQEPEKARLAKYYYSKAVEKQSPTFDLVSRYIQACYFVGQYIETDEVTKDEIFLQGANYAMNLIHDSEAYKKLDVTTRATKSELELLTWPNLTEEYVPIIYWWVANIGRYLINKSIGERLKYTKSVQTALNRIIELDPDYYYGGPYRLLGTLYVRIPGFDIELAETFFQSSIDAYPNCFSTSVLMAQYCSTKANDREQFRKLLENVVNSDPNAIPEIAPENVFEQNIAKRLLQMEFLLFE